MHTRIALLAGLTGVALSLGAGAALAGPCTDQIAELGKTLSQSPALGPVTTGALGGSNPGNVQTTTDRPGAPSTVGTSADNRVVTAMVRRRRPRARPTRDGADLTYLFPVA